MSADQKFATIRDAMGHPVPVAPQNVKFVPTRQVDDVLYLSGHLPFWGAQEGRPFLPDAYKGKVEGVVSSEKASEAAKVTALNLLFSARRALVSLDKVLRVVEVFGMVDSSPGFFKQPEVIDGCSEILLQVFGDEAGAHARCAVGVAELPFNACVEIKLILQVGCP
jgi:enamine deaminase RidA (YjgF/YER057c/UK114 family)